MAAAAPLGAIGGRPVLVEYGSLRDQVADLWLPDGGRPRGVVALIHGGFWMDVYGRSLMDDLARDLIKRGLAAWNLEYRRVGGEAWTGPEDTLQDVAAGLDKLTAGDVPDLPAGLPAAVVGHSAGGHLALWSQLRRSDAEAPTGPPAISVAIAAAGVVDLRRAEAQNLGGGAVQRFLRRPVASMKSEVSPIDMLPPSVAGGDDGGSVSGSDATVRGTRFGLVHGVWDNIVPLEQSERFHAAAVRAGVPSDINRVDWEGHFEILDPSSRSWAAALELIEPAMEVKG